MRFKNSQVEEDWNNWVIRSENHTDPTVRDTVKFGQKFVELAEAKIDEGVPVADCWSDLVGLAGVDMMNFSGGTIRGTLRTVAAAWEHGDELKRAMSSH